MMHRLISMAFLVATLASAQVDSGASLRVDTVPAGATVWCNGEERGTAPVTLTNLEPGDHLIVASMKGHEEERKTVALTAGGTAALTLTLRPAMGLVLIQSDPESADVFEGETALGRTPLFLDELSLGQHRLALRMNGFTEKIVDLKLPDRTPVPVLVELTSDSATVVASSTPAGAMVLVNGVEKGRTPLTIKGIPGGETTIELQLAGYETLTRRLNLSAGQEEAITLTLKPLPATLTLVSIPPKARLYIENQFAGEAPVEKKNLAAGEVRVRAELPGYRSLARTLTLKRGDNLTEEFRLERDTGRLVVVTRPAGVEVRVDGKAAGTTKSGQGASADAYSEPLRLDVAAGEKHRVTLVRDGYLDDAHAVTIKSGETNEIRSTLQRVIVIDTEVETAYGSFSGALVERYADGSIKLETSPNRFKTIPAADILKMTRPGIDGE